jgi:hypothetical protein
MRYVIALVALLAACSNEHYDSGLTVRVEDANGRPLCDAVVVAAEGGYRETLDDKALDDCLFRGAGERAGRYTLTVGKNGYRTSETTVQIERDFCHVQNKSLTVRLSPL